MTSQSVNLIHNRDGEIGSWETLIAELERFVDESSEWLVAVPLSNAPVAGYTEIDEHTGLAELNQDGSPAVLETRETPWRAEIIPQVERKEITSSFPPAVSRRPKR